MTCLFFALSSRRKPGSSHPYFLEPTSAGVTNKVSTQKSRVLCHSERSEESFSASLIRKRFLPLVEMTGALLLRHPGESRDPVTPIFWTPASAGVTRCIFLLPRNACLLSVNRCPQFAVYYSPSTTPPPRRDPHKTAYRRPRQI